MKTYLKLVAVLVVLGVSFVSLSVQAGGHDGAKGKGNAKGMNSHANPRAALGGMGGTDGSAIPDMGRSATAGANAHGMNPNANPRAALGGLNSADKRAERLAEREAAKAARKAEQEARRAANPDDAVEAPVVDEPIASDIPV